MAHNALKLSYREVDRTGRVLRVVKQHYAHFELSDEEFNEVGDNIRQAIEEETDFWMKQSLEKEGLTEYIWRKAERAYYKGSDANINVDIDNNPEAENVRKLRRDWRKAKKDLDTAYWKSKEEEQAQKEAYWKRKQEEQAQKQQEQTQKQEEQPQNK